MGYEYMLDREVPDPAEADRVLRIVAGFTGCRSEFQLRSFRRRATGPMPDADAKSERSGIGVEDQGVGYPIVEDILAARSAVGLHARLREL